MVCNPQCDQRWGRGIGGLLDGRAPQQATFHSQGMPRNIPHLNGCERPPPARHAPLGQPRRVWPLCCPAGVCARPAQSHRGRAGSGQGSPAPLHGRLPWASPLSSSLFPALTRLWGVRQLGLGEWAGRSGHEVKEGRRSDPSPEGAALIPQVKDWLAPQPTQAAGTGLGSPSSCWAGDPIFQLTSPFLHSENLFHSRDHP